MRHVAWIWRKNWFNTGLKQLSSLFRLVLWIHVELHVSLSAQSERTFHCTANDRTVLVDTDCCVRDCIRSVIVEDVTVRSTSTMRRIYLSSLEVVCRVALSVCRSLLDPPIPYSRLLLGYIRYDDQLFGKITRSLCMQRFWSGWN